MLVDEFQDTNYAQLALVQLLAGQAGNLTVVADDDQCLLEGTPVRMGDGTVKAIEDVAVGDEVLSAIGAGRFAARRVTRTVRRQAAAGVGLELVDGRDLVSTPEHTHFAAFDAATLDGRFVTYLMFKRGVGYRVGMARGCYWMQGQPRLGAAHRVLHERAQAAWILTVHETEEQARIHEAVVAATYGLPTLPFRKTAGASSGLCSNQGALDAVHATIDSNRGAKRLAADLGLRLEYPHVRPQSVSGRCAPGTQPTRLVRVTLCGHRTSQVHHLVRAYGTDAAGAEALESAGHKVRHYRGRWEFAAARRDYGQALALGREIARLLGGEVYEAMSVGGGRRKTRTLPLINAADVRPGMVVATEEGQLVEVAQVEPVVLDRPVYDLDVDGSHNFVANGIVTHNCLYKFRGAEPDNVLRFTESFPTACSVTLGRNFRSHSEIVELVGRSIEHNTRRVHKEFVAHRGPGGKVECWAFASDVDEAEWIAHQMSEALAAGVGHEEIMAIAGTNFATNRLQHTLASYGIAHRVLGALGLFERREVKDAMAYLQLLGNPQDAQAFRRASSSPRRGVGAATANRIIEAARAGDGDLVAACVNLPNIGRVPKATRDKLALFGQEMLRLRSEQQAGRSVGHIVTGSVAMAGGIVRYHQEIRDGQDASNADRRDAERVLEDLRSLCRAAHHHDETDPQPSLTAFLEQAALTTTVDVDGPDERITISTIHKAKGTEASLVFVLGCEEGLLPSGKALEEGDELTIEEQRRLFYVAATRAKDRLVLTMAHQRNDRPTDGPSRFLREAGAF